MTRDELVPYIEAALLSAGRPVAVDELAAMFEGREDAPDRGAIREAVAALAERWHGHSVEVAQVASGFRAQIRKEFSQVISALWQERPARYSRALLETLSLIAYRQPVSRGEIEEVRGVSVSSSIMKTLVEREWVHVVGHREAPGRPALYGTTKHFLDSFGLGSLEALPPLAELKDLEDPPPDLFTGLQEAAVAGEGSEVSAAGEGSEVSAAGEAPEASVAGEAPEASAAGEAPEASAAGEAPEVSAAGEGSEASVAGEAPEVSAAGEGSEVSAAGEGSEVSAAGEAPEVSAADEGSELSVAGEGSEVSVACEGPEPSVSGETPETFAAGEILERSVSGEAPEPPARGEVPESSASVPEAGAGDVGTAD